jgi:thioredoxin-dependent peroxiredoxin
MFGSLLTVGAPAPDFSVTDEKGNAVTLKSIHGAPAVLIFYPGDDTPICTKQLCEIRDGWSEFERRKVRVFGVNGQGQASHESFRKKFDLPFPLLIDKGWRMSRAYGCGMWLVRRTVYVLTPYGHVAFAQRGKPSTTEILAAL